jgi:hypothetical protein
MNNIIKFHSYHPSNNTTKDYRPEPVKDNIPQWFLEKNKFKTNPDGTYQLVRYKTEEIDKIHRIPSWKSCPAMLDVFMSGYYLFTPCDIIVKPNDGSLQKELHHYQLGTSMVEYDEKWKGFGPAKAFCDYRGVEDGLPTPEGYLSHTLVWRPNWYFEVPKGYTVLFTHPINIIDLPFKTMTGFSDASNKQMISGNYPFYIKENWYGTIPAGTPYAQVIPIKIESWSAEIIEYSIEELAKNKQEQHKYYIVGNSMTKYKQIDWTKKHYE